VLENSERPLIAYGSAHTISVKAGPILATAAGAALSPTGRHSAILHEKRA
jgi:hypothetical protein